MPEKSLKRKLRSDQSTSQIDEDVASLTNDESTLLSDNDFEDISNKIKNKISKRLRDTELNQREILKLIESSSSKVDNLSKSPEGKLIRVVSQPQQSCENLDTKGTPKGGNEEIDKEEKETSS